MDTWTLDDSGYGYGDWKNLLDYDNYDGKRLKKQKNSKQLSSEPEQPHFDFEINLQNENPVALPF